VAAPRVCPDCSHPLPRRGPRFCGRCGAWLGSGGRRPTSRASPSLPPRISGPRPLSALGTLVLAGAVLALWPRPVATVEAPPTPAVLARPSLEDASPGRELAGTDLVGVWLQTSHPDDLSLVVAFEPDGTFRMDEEGDLLHRPAAHGTYRLDGRRLHLADVAGAGCPRGHRSVWDALLDARGRLTVAASPLTLEGCPLDGDGARSFRRVSPGDVQILESLGATAAERQATLRELRGLWLQVTDPRHLGLLISFDPEGTFTADERGRLGDDPTARGSLRVDDGILTFSSDGTPACFAHERWSWRATLPVSGELRVEALPGMRHGGCLAAPGPSLTFVRISPSSYGSGPLFEPG
jgi:hypothetical protein